MDEDRKPNEYPNTYANTYPDPNTLAHYNRLYQLDPYAYAELWHVYLEAKAASGEVKARKDKADKGK